MWTGLFFFVSLRVRNDDSEKSFSGKQADEITNLIDKAVDLYNDLREKVVKSSGAEKPKVCFTSIRKELLEKTDALYDELAATVKKILGD